MSLASAGITLLADARVVPPLRDPREFRKRPGVFDSEGRFCDAANVQRGGRFELSPSHLAATPATRLAGCHLYGGQINRHFGHFLCESLSRLWALDQAGVKVSSILFLPRRPGSSRALLEVHKRVLELFDLPVPVHLVDEPLRVDTLVVPDQAFGIGDLCAGTPEFRAYIHRRFAPDIAADGPEDLYISREALNLQSGSILGEGALSANLIQSGYSAFSPERHDIRSQIAHYKAARRIIAVEGSALHLYGLVGHADQRVAIVQRRSDGEATRAIAAQIRAFCHNDPAILDAISEEWDMRPGPIRSSKSVCILDMAALGQKLAALGMADDRPWISARTNAEHRITRIARRTGRALAPVPRSG